MQIKAVQQFMLGTVTNNEPQARDTLQKMKDAGYNAMSLRAICEKGFVHRKDTKKE